MPCRTTESSRSSGIHIPGMGMIPPAKHPTSTAAKSKGMTVHIPGMGMIPSPASRSPKSAAFHIPGMGMIPTSVEGRPTPDFPPVGFAPSVSSRSLENDDDMSSLDDSFCSANSLSSVGSRASTSSSVVAGIGSVPLSVSSPPATASMPSLRSWSTITGVSPQTGNNATFLQRAHQTSKPSSNYNTTRLLAALGSSAPCAGRKLRHSSTSDRKVRKNTASSSAGTSQRRFHSHSSLRSLKHVPSMQTVHEYE